MFTIARRPSAEIQNGQNQAKYGLKPVFLLLLCVVSLFLAHHLIASYLKYGTFLFESGQAHQDRLISYSLARAAQEYGLNFLDPYSRQDLITYQFFLYWILGFISRVFNRYPWEVANVIQLFLAPLFFIVIYKLAYQITGYKKVALTSVVLTFSFGSLEFLTTANSGPIIYGDHAQIFSFVRQIYGFYIDSYALLFDYLSLIYFVKLLKKKEFSFRNTLFFLVFASMGFCMHLLPAVYFIVLFGFLLIANTLYENQGDRDKIVLISAAGIYLIILVIFKCRVPMHILGGYALFISTYFFIRSRAKSRYLIVLISLIPVTIITGLNVYLVNSTGSSGFSYNDVVRTKQLYIPVAIYISSYLPFLILSGITVMKSKQEDSIRYYAPMLIAAIVMIYNNYFGYNNHPYRYIPYAFPILSIISAQGLYILYSNIKKEKGKILTANYLAFIVMLALIAAGTYSNIYEYSKYAYNNGSYEAYEPADTPVSKVVLDIADSIETVRKSDKDAVFLVDPSIIRHAGDYPAYVEKLAPYTAAKFYYISSLAYSNKYPGSVITGLSKLSTYRQAGNYIRSNRAKIDYVVRGSSYKDLPKDNRYLAYRKDGIYIYRVGRAHD